jgi:hypothetical protein
MSVWLKLRTLFRRHDVELELDEEIRYEHRAPDRARGVESPAVMGSPRVVHGTSTHGEGQNTASKIGRSLPA